MTAIVGLCATVAAARKPPPEPRTPYVQLDVVVTDDLGHLSRGLRASDFDVREDGEPVALDSVTAVNVTGGAENGVTRSVVLLLDDTLTPAIRTTTVQGLARMFLSHASADDAVAVVRLTHRGDDAVGPLELAAARIDEYRGRALPFFGIESIQNLLKTVARISAAVAANPPRRTAVVCIGGRVLCDPYFERPESSMARREWHQAIVAAARANVAVYYVDPAGVTGAGADLGYGLVDHTGGAAFTQTNTFEHAVDAIWDEAGHYYVLGYTPTTKPRDLHSIRVRATRAGLHARARLARGD